MKKSLLTCLWAVICLGFFVDAHAEVALTTDYHEDFTSLLTGQQYSAPYPLRYWMREGKSFNLNKLNNYDADANATTKAAASVTSSNTGDESSQSEVLITPQVGGTVTFYVRRNVASTSSSQKSELGLYVMTYTVGDNGKLVWTRKSLGAEDGTVDGITVNGLTSANNISNANNQSAYNWIEIKLTNVPEKTFLGVRLKYLAMDEFKATKAWLQWPDEMPAEMTLTPAVDITSLNGDYNRLYLDEKGNWKFSSRMQLKTIFKAGNVTADHFKFGIYAVFTSALPDATLPTEVKVGEVTFTQLPNKDWNADIYAEVQDFNIDMTLAPGYFLQPFTFRLNNGKGTISDLQRAYNMNNTYWTTSSWTSIRPEGMVAQPKFGYYSPAIAEPNSSQVYKFTDPHPFIINQVTNRATVGMGNEAGKATMKVTGVMFSGEEFGLKDNITFPITVDPKGVAKLDVALKTTTPGKYTGTMYVYVDGFDDPFTTSLEGSCKPTTEGIASYIFHNPDGTTGATIPKGWLATGKWSIRPLTMMLTKIEGAWVEAAGLDNNIETDLSSPFTMSSPKLHFEAGEKFYFDATGNGSTTSPGTDILISKDRVNWEVVRSLISAPYTPTEENPLTDDHFSYYGAGGYGAQPAFRTFVSTIDEAGDYYIGFRTGNTGTNCIDNFVGGKEVVVDFDMAYIASNIGWKSKVNTPKTMTMTVCNLAEEIAADAYDIQVLVNGEVVKTIKGSKAIPQGGNTELEAEYTFTEPGVYKVMLKLVKGANTVATPESEFTVNNEILEERFQVGPTHSTSGYICDDYNSWPLTPQTTCESKMEIIFNKAILQNIDENGASAANGNLGTLYDSESTAPLTGLKNGDKITSLEWIAYVKPNTSMKPWPTHVELNDVKLYFENTTNSATITEFSDVDWLTEVHNGKVVFDLSKNGESRKIEDANTPKGLDMKEGLIRFELDEPFEYTGDNLRVVLILPKVYFDKANHNEEDGGTYFDFYAKETDSSVASQIWAIFSKTQYGTEDANYSRLRYQNSTWGTGSASDMVPVVIFGKESQNIISGKVTDAATEAAIEGAAVTLTSTTGAVYNATSDATGAYAIKVPKAEAQYTIAVTAEGYWDYTTAETINVTGEDVTKDIAMREKALTVKGVVKGKDGVLANARVELCHALSPAVQVANTDEKGAFAIKTNLVTTDHIIKVSAPFYKLYEQRFGVGDVDHDLGEITLEHMTAVISGTVKGDDGLMSGAKVTIKDVKTNVTSEATTDENGAYSFTVDGLGTDYKITVEAPYYIAYEGQFAIGDQNVDVPEITLVHMTATISGTVKGDDGMLSGAKVTIKDVKTNVTSEATTDENGAYSFTVKGLDTDYEITVEATYYETYNGRTAVGVTDVTVPEIVMTHLQVTVSGTVNGDEGALAGATVTFGSGEDAMTATTGDDGAFSFTTKALDTKQQLAVTADGYVDYSAEIDVAQADVDCGTIEMEHIVVKVSGKVVDEAGAAIEGAKVTFKADDDNALEATTGADGTFEFSTKLLDSEWTLTVEAEDYDTVEQSVSVARENIELGDITLKKTLGIGAIYADGGIKVIPGIGSITIIADGQKVIVSDTMGRVISKFDSLKGSETVDGLTGGIYLVNHTKVLVK